MWARLIKTLYVTSDDSQSVQSRTQQFHHQPLYNNFKNFVVAETREFSSSVLLVILIHHILYHCGICCTAHQICHVSSRYH